MDLICRALGDDSVVNGKKRRKLALKVMVHFKTHTLNCGPVHLGGVHFHSPMANNDRNCPSPSIRTTPHVYTTTGIVGDHQGTRCWLPSIDSARWNHRCTHEISIAVTARKEDGLWATGFGEDFGLNDVIFHPMPSFPNTNYSGNALRASLIEILGQRHVSFIAESGKDINHSQQFSSRPADLATAIWVSALWNPAPSRSLGFAIAPFHIVYDREYYNKLDNNDEEDDDGERKKIDKEKVSIAFQSAIKKGEGIRQLYFADPQDRISIHKGRALVRTTDHPITFKLSMQRHGSKSETNIFAPLNSTERAIIASTDGVPMRALSLMRGVLSLPRFRTSSYTQIWIPLVVDGGSSSGALCTHPEVSCNAFIGGAIFDSLLLHPPSLRLPYYAGGRILQFLQAQAVIKGWITAAVPLGGDDDIGQSYILTLFECLLMSLYERSHGAFGEGGGKSSFFFCDRYAKKSGFNSGNMDFLPIYNIEDEGIAASSFQRTQGGTFLVNIVFGFFESTLTATSLPNKTIVQMSIYGGAWLMELNHTHHLLTSSLFVNS